MGDNARNCQETGKKFLYCTKDHPTFDNCIRMRTNKEVNTSLAHSDVNVYEALTMAKDKMGIPTQKTQNDNTQTINNNKNFPKLQTNNYTRRKLERKTLSPYSIWRTWYNVTTEEMWAFIGVIINMRTMPLANL